MSVNPVPPTGAAGANIPVEQLIAAELEALAADAQVLETQLTVGQVVTAQVLPSNGLTDLINILGNRVAAALPPNLQPGDLFSAQVTGFNNGQILLQFLNTVEAGQPNVQVPPPVLESPLQSTPSEEPMSALAAAAAVPKLPDGVEPSLAPPPAVFVAASVRPAPPPLPGSPQISMPSAQALAPQLPDGLADIEARLAAARAGQVGVNIPSPQSAAGPPQIANGQTPPSGPPVLPGTPLPPPAAAGRFVFAPPITPSTRVPDGAPAPAPNGAPPPAANPSTNAPQTPSLATYRDPAALVRALNLPVTPTNIAAAKMAIDTPARLPSALATLESALPNTDDPRVATLRTLTAFIGKMQPDSPQLAQQISSYVDNVVAGNEPKLATLLNAQVFAEQQTAPPAQNAPPANTQPQTPGVPVQPAAPAPPQPVTQPALPVVVLAQAAERAAALNVDLKTALLSLVNNPPPGASNTNDLVSAASSALTAVTAVQVNAAQAMNVTPQQMAFTLPMWVGNGYQQARVAIDRDAPDQRGRGLDGDNFHIAFILDTKHLGTVAVDLQTVGRAFTLSVKAENERSAKHFAEAMTRLTGRLETLRYRVNSAEAAVAPRGVQPPVPETPPPPVVAGDDDGFANNMNVRA